MRNGNKSRQLLSLARIFVLALCFALVFAVALSANNAQVANAYNVERQDKKDDATLGSAAAFYGDSGELTGVHFGYPGLSANTTSWSYEETYNTIVPSLSNHQIFKLKGNTTMYTHVGDANHWLWGVEDGMAAAEVHGVINFNLGGFIAQMIQNDNVTVKAKVTANIGAKEGDSTWLVEYVNNLFYSAVAVPYGKQLTAGLSYDLRNNKSESGQDKTGFVSGYQNSNSKGAKDRTSNEVTLTKDTPGLGFALGCGWGQQAGSYDHHVYMSNIRVTFTITLNGSITDNDSLKISDNAAPMASSIYGIQNSYSEGKTGSNYYPNITDATDSPVYYDSIKRGIKLDNIANGEGKMISYTNKSLGTISYNGTNYNYYKFAQTEYVDMYNYSGEGSIQAAIAKYGADAAKTIGVGDRLITGISGTSFTTTETTNATHLKYASGIRSVTINDATRFDVWNSADRDVLKPITIENDKGQEVTIGFAKVHYINRGRVAVMLYMTDNGSVKTDVEDYGGKSSDGTRVKGKSTPTRIEFSGIDTTAPTSKIGADGKETVNSGTQVSLDNYIQLGANTNKLEWFRQNNLTAEAEINIVEDDTAAGYAPYIWFYTVNRADSLAALNSIGITQFANYAAVKAAGINPIAYGNLSTFRYDFVNGKAKAYGGGDQGNPSSITDKVTGHGYYRFTFYLFDIAGNKGSVQTYYMKVDYDKPEYTLNFQYKNGNTWTGIDAANNGKWTTGDVRLKFTINQGGFSGYTLRFEDKSGTAHALVANGSGEYSGSSYQATLLKYVAGTTATDVTGNTATITINGKEITVTYSVEDGKSVFLFDVPAPGEGQYFYEWVSAFSAYAGQYASIAAIDGADQVVEYTDTAWKGGVKVLIDNKAPELPTFVDENEDISYIKAFEDGNYTIPLLRDWYTSSYSLQATLGFSDAILSTDYAKGLKIHYGISAVKTKSDLESIEGYFNTKDYRTSTNPQEDFKFNRYILVTGNQINDGGVTDFAVDLLAMQGAGMRVIHIWAEDQAGNVSALNKYYVFVDTNTYSVSAAVKSNDKFENNFASISVVNAEGKAVTSAKRGEKLTFNVSFAGNYVPFAFNNNAAKLLENYDSILTWQNVAGDNAGYITFAPFDSEGASTIELTLDDANDLNALQLSNRFELAARRKVSASLTSRTVPYTSEPTVVANWMNFTYPQSKDSFVYDFVDNGTIATTPTKVGKYKVRIYIPKDDDSFVTDDFAMNESGEQIFAEFDYEIVKGKVVITAKDVVVSYGASAALDYDVTGIAKDKMSGEGINVALLVNGTNNSRGVLDVGPYQILNNASYSEVENYDVTFVSGTYTVLQRRVMITAVNAIKKYGDADPKLSFGVDLAQFAHLYASESEILKEIFDGYGYVENGEITATNYVFYFADGRISRVEGEGVSQYAYNANATLFDVNKNYSIGIQTENRYFTIEKRTVELDISGQNSVFPSGTDLSDAVLGAIRPSYKLAAKDIVVAGEVDAIFANGSFLKLVAPGTETTVEGYEKVVAYKVAIDGTFDNGNIQIVVGGGEYLVYITAQNVVVVKAKAGAKFEFVFGHQWNDLTSLVFDAAKFEVQGASADFTSVTWSASISGVENGAWLGAGRYTVTIDGAKLVNGSSELQDAVVVEPVVITVNPAQVVIVPTASATSKVYGDQDRAYGFGFAIKSVNGTALAADGTYAGMSYDAIKDKIKGAYVRAIYKDGGRVSFANRYDDATDEAGAILNAKDKYYSFAIGTNFYSENNDFSVQAELDLSTKLIIAQKEIQLETKYFVGLSKTVDENTIVPYVKNNVTMYDLTRHLVRATDDVKLLANANYDSKEVGNNKSISFDTFKLDGSKAHNYKLATVLNNNGNKTQVNDSTEGDIVVTIFWIDNENGVGTIEIWEGAIKFGKSDVIVKKQYDNTTDLTVDNIAFETLALNTAKKDLVSESKFTGKDVGDNYIVTISVFFEGFEKHEFSVDDSSITIDKTATYNGKTGALITISNLKAEITQRRIDRDSFESLDAVDRDYNGTTSVDIAFTFKSGALAIGDKAQTVGLQLKGLVDDANVGSSKSVVIDAVNSKVADSNYVVDAQSISLGYSQLDVEITKARLIPNINFMDKVYNGESTLEKGVDWDVVGTQGTFTTVQYADNLKDELAMFSFDATKVKFALSLNGNANPNVQANGKHNVLVSGLEIAFGGTEEQKARILNNYRLEGSVFSATDGKYNQINTLTIGAADDFEILDALNLGKKQITLKVNDFGVNNKYYDGTTDIDIVVTIDDERIIPAHASLFEVVTSGAFARRQVGKNIEIALSTATLKVKDALSDSESKQALETIGNYELVQYKGVLTGDINARPLLVSANLGEKEYNGDEAVVKNNISYTFKGMMPGDERYYAIQTRNNAYFDDKNVEIERDVDGNPVLDENGNFIVIAKLGTAYNLRLSNSKELYENYTLVYNSTNKIEGKEIAAYVVNGEVFFGTPGAGVENIEEYWYNLETTKYYIEATETENIAAAKNANAIVGFYKFGSQGVYMVSKQYALNDDSTVKSDLGVKSFGDKEDEINYLRGEGKITQREVYIRANGIERKAGSTAFEKTFDGTDKFFGELNTDFDYNSTAVANVVTGDDVTIKSVTAKFDSAYANAKYVVFTASGIDGKDAYNYTIEGKTVSTVNLEGKIKTRTINASLNDAEAEYGVSTGRFNGTVEYALVGNNGKTYTLINAYASDSSFYMEFEQFLSAVGFADRADVNELASLLADRTYNLAENGAFEKAAEGTKGEYIRLGGDANDRISALPQAYVSFSATMPDAGSTSTSFRFNTQGNAKNFKFVGIYTNKDENNETGTDSVLTVKKKDLYIVTVSNGYSKKYGVGAMPNVELLYLDRNGAKGIVGGQSVITLFKSGTTNYYPEFKLGIYNAQTGTTIEAPETAKISADLGANEYYVFYLVAPNDVDYNTLDTMVKNYNVILAGKDSVKHKLVDVDGVQVVRTVFDMTGEGALVSPETATLEMTLPTLDGISVGSDSSDKISYVYAIDKNNKGINRLRDSVKGVYDTDEVSFVGADGQSLEPVNVGTYSGTINVRRYINADGNFVTRENKDVNGYYIEWNSGDVQKQIEITKASIGLRASNVSEYYNGKAHPYANDSNRDRISYNTLVDNTGLLGSDFVITYEVYKDGKYQPTTESEIVNAGKYKVTVKFDPSGRKADDPIRVNYESATAIADLQVLRAIVNVKVEDDEYTRTDGGSAETSTVHNFTAAYVKDKKYTVVYSISMDDLSNDASIAITKDQTRLVGLDDIDGAGRYAFAIELNDDSLNADNYVFMRGTGMLVLTTTKLDAENGDTIEVKTGAGLVANKLDVKEIKSNGKKTADDTSYLEAVEAYVAAMKVANARVSAVYRVNLYLNDQLVLLSGNTVKVTVNMPDALSSLDGITIYYVNSNGGLTKLKLAEDGNNLKNGEYTVNAEGKIEYATDYVNGLVFVNTAPEKMATWKLHAICTAVGLVVIIVVATLVAFIVKKSKLKKLA